MHKDSEFIFIGTGTSSCVPNVVCITKQPAPTCNVCLKAVGVAETDDSRVDARRAHAAVPRTPLPNRNRRNNTCAVYRYRHSDGRIRTILIDAGKTFYTAALAWFPHYGITQIDAVLLTHGHADAMMGLDDLRMWTLDSIPSIPVYLNKETMGVVASAFPYIVDRTKATGGGQIPSLEFHVFDEAPLLNECETAEDGFHRVLRIDELDVVPFNVVHGRLSDGNPYYASGFKFPGITYISDTNEIPEVSQRLIRNSEVLVLDGLRYNLHPSHMGVIRSIEEAQLLQPKKLVLTGFCHDIDHYDLEARLAGNQELKDAGVVEALPAYDGMVIPLSGNIV
ncbi:hypothetical protein HDU77_011667 [Chytriomyces hyalinus]|nr:hypothetical protein HDU77_011667 [Chytriomyces hyalinus]